MEHNIMLDLETMGTSYNAPIIAVGAVHFVPAAKKIADRFYVVVDLQSSVDAGATMDVSTVLWWMQQSEEARAEFKRKGEKIDACLALFNHWLSGIGKKKDIVVWGNGATFDNVIIRNAYNNSGIEAGWEYWNDRCYRTIKALNKQILPKRTGTHHNAVNDAETQALHLMEIL